MDLAWEKSDLCVHVYFNIVFVTKYYCTNFEITTKSKNVYILIMTRRWMGKIRTRDVRVPFGEDGGGGGVKERVRGHQTVCRKRNLFETDGISTVGLQPTYSYLRRISVLKKSVWMAMGTGWVGGQCGKIDRWIRILSLTIPLSHRCR